MNHVPAGMGKGPKSQPERNTEGTGLIPGSKMGTTNSQKTIECEMTGSKKIERSVDQKYAASNDGAFAARHIGPRTGVGVRNELGQLQAMLEQLSALGTSPSTSKCKTLDDFIAQVVPDAIRMRHPLRLSRFPSSLTEEQALARIRELASLNKIRRSLIGQGYYGCHTPTVIQRNILENPGWYTQYTPYQPEISQGRLEALLNYQTLICDLTALPFSNASLLDEGTAAAEALHICLAVREKGALPEKPQFFVSRDCFPQTIAVLKTRAEALGIEVIEGDPQQANFPKDLLGVLLQYPDCRGGIADLPALIERAHASNALVVVATDLLALTLLKPPGEMGADIALGNSQRFGVPLGFGGPHAGFFAVRDGLQRQMPGRLIGVTRDAAGGSALRLALQTREQHIRREKATSNICTAQVLLAVMASMYAVYHGPRGLRAIAERVHGLTLRLAEGLHRKGLALAHSRYFDTLALTVEASEAERLLAQADAQGYNLARIDPQTLGISLDETCTEADLQALGKIFGIEVPASSNQSALPSSLLRTSAYLQQSVFNRYQSETEFLRYVRRLESRDLSLATAMIPLGSCTMKLNATSEMLPVSWPEFSQLHPFGPAVQSAGYQQLFSDLEVSLAEITGFDAVSLQPNSGAQGEYAGLLAIRAYLRSIGQAQRTVCLIPMSAHGTNPASAAMASMQVVPVNCDAAGNVDVDDLRAKAELHAPKLAALMVTYPSTHGVFEERVQELCAIAHQHGAQVYMDGANLNAQVGLCRPADIGADVCHINLHKTFCIPHGGGGPGMGPIAVKQHLAPFLPGHPVVVQKGRSSVGPVSAAPWGSASILPISWMYMAMMGQEYLPLATKIAILNANYIAARLDAAYPVLYRGKHGFVAHECILDLRPLKKSSGVEVEDVAKRLMDYGFHAPTVSFPVPGCLMIEPTESESKEELDRFCEAMLSIRKEIAKIETGEFDAKDNPLKNAPHTSLAVCADVWPHPYSRELAAFPAPWCREYKFWPSVARVDASYGDRNLICTCTSMGELAG
jgi:glycine dehydrogenase